MTTIPPMLPWQTQHDGGVAGTEVTEVITPTVDGLRVEAVFGAIVHPTQWAWGDGEFQDSTDNTAGHTYLAAGTYTVTASNGEANGSVEVTVAEAGTRKGKGKK